MQIINGNVIIPIKDFTKLSGLAFLGSVALHGVIIYIGIKLVQKTVSKK